MTVIPAAVCCDLFYRIVLKVHKCVSFWLEFAFEIEVVFQKINVTIAKLLPFLKTKSDDLTIVTFDIFISKNVKCDDC